MEKKTVWFRIGATIDCTDEELKEIVETGVVENMDVTIDEASDAYIPDGVMEDLGYKGDCELTFRNITVNGQRSRQIDWEQRRYEIAKDVLAAMRIGGMYSVEKAVQMADKLIEELKK